MFRKINIFIGGSTDKDISHSYRKTAIELGQKINKRKDYLITFETELLFSLLSIVRTPYIY